MYGGGSREVVSDSTKGGRIEARRKAGFPWSGLRKQFIRQWSRCERRTLLTSALALVFVCMFVARRKGKEGGSHRWVPSDIRIPTYGVFGWIVDMRSTDRPTDRPDKREKKR